MFQYPRRWPSDLNEARAVAEVRGGTSGCSGGRVRGEGNSRRRRRGGAAPPPPGRGAGGHPRRPPCQVPGGVLAGTPTAHPARSREGSGHLRLPEAGTHGGHALGRCLAVAEDSGRRPGGKPSRASDLDFRRTHESKGEAEHRHEPVTSSVPPRLLP